MMNINIKDTLILSDDNAYIVISKVYFNNNLYYYLIDKNNDEMKILYKNKSMENALTEVTDNNLIQALLPVFISEAKEELKKYLDE